MISILLFAILAGQCAQTHAVAPIVHQQQVALTVPYVDPYWSYVVGHGADARIKKLEESIEKLTTIADRQSQILEHLRGQGSGSTPSAGESAITSQARQVLQTNCASCHTGDAAKGSFRLDRELSVADKLLVSQVVTSGAMPPAPKEPLSDDEAAIIAAWANEDKQAVRAWLRSQREPRKEEDHEN
jgi:mono/diheme cytochrome c family protein